MRRTFLSASVLLVAIVAACSGTAGSPTTVPATLPPPTTAPAPSLAATGPTVSVDSSGNFVGPNGLTLYHFDKDAADKSNCTSSQCVANWPALTVASASAITLGAGLDASSFATITGPTGGLQVTFNHVPLYNFAGDSKPGDKNGDGVGGIWHIANVSTTPPAASSAPSSAPPQHGRERRTERGRIDPQGFVRRVPRRVQLRHPVPVRLAVGGALLDRSTRSADTPALRGQIEHFGRHLSLAGSLWRPPSLGRRWQQRRPPLLMCTDYARRMRRQWVLLSLATAVLVAGCFGGPGPSPTPIQPPIASFPDFFAPPTTVLPSPTIAVGVGTVNADASGVLLNAQGFTLYTFDNDAPDSSACAEDCTADFEPLTVPSAQELSVGLGLTAGDFSTFARGDGTIQVEYRQHPLYAYAGDENPGDMLGDGIGGVWHTARKA